MKKSVRRTMMLAAICLALPLLSQAQGFGDNISGLNGELEKLFNQFLPKCSLMMDVGRAIGGFAALWFVAVRVWKHLARAEAIDFYPLLRPFAIGLAILLFPALVNLMNGVLSPVVSATRDLSKNSGQAIAWQLDQEEKAATQAPPPGIYNNGQGQQWEQYSQPEGANADQADMGSIFSYFSFKSMAKNFVRVVVQVLYQAAALCINTVRTFYLIILVLLGPLVLGLSVFDGFGHSLSNWFARYVNVYMWLPVANIFGAIISTLLENMLTLDNNFFASTTYIIFMIMGIVGYFTVPTVAGYIIQPGGADALTQKVSSAPGQIAQGAATVAKVLI
ncbi:Bacteroides conjugative transposon TraJ protein [Pedobacter suwonensis]|uniref:Bacteroides conjugative transposon TraJ protein n=1 Tax=Pedobacter suwonensis TaxID=332999 RepID=A0A1I0TXV0_9SPHI|nr:conjugative transposon protein TraJ [Pedobacter suwonensis]SFA56490.1 Bacteroides conjugative transposon TraJ protein [Pedobacter suwonensis]